MAFFLSIKQVGGEEHLLSDFVISFSGPSTEELPAEFSLQDGASVRSGALTFGSRGGANNVALVPGDTLQLVTPDSNAEFLAASPVWLVER